MDIRHYTLTTDKGVPLGWLGKGLLWFIALGLMQTRQAVMNSQQPTEIKHSLTLHKQ